MWKCFYALKKFASRNSVNLGWVPDHAGVECNECADELAKRGGANMPFLGVEPWCGISKATTNHLINKWSRNQHYQLTCGYSGQAFGKQQLTDSGTHFNSWLIKLSRSQVKQEIDLSTRHGHFRKHLHTLDIQVCNQTTETAKHVIADCVRLGARLGLIASNQVMNQTLGLEKARGPSDGHGHWLSPTWTNGIFGIWWGPNVIPNDVIKCSPCWSFVCHERNGKNSYLPMEVL